MSWASVYGKLTEIDGETWVDMPLILRGEALRYVVNCSSAALERSMTSLKKKGLVVSEADRFRQQIAAVIAQLSLVRRAQTAQAAELQAAAGPGVRLIDGSAGIARRIAHLTEGQPWPAAAAPGIAVFTRSDANPPPPLAALAPYGIGRIETI